MSVAKSMDCLLLLPSASATRLIYQATGSQIAVVDAVFCELPADKK
jgi:hypothetical protein